jgi:polar amino acid transport system substrate-binding protein
MRRSIRRCSALVVLAATAACTAIPRDVNGALASVRGGVLRVGVVEHPPWIIVDDGAVSGSEAQLIERWAAQLAARVEWRPGDIDQLVDALHRREIDVLAGGLGQKTPYAHRLALTQPYADVEDPHGKKQRLVLAVTPGESALLLELDRFLSSDSVRTGATVRGGEGPALEP